MHRWLLRTPRLSSRTCRHRILHLLLCSPDSLHMLRQHHTSGQFQSSVLSLHRIICPDDLRLRMHVNVAVLHHSRRCTCMGRSMLPLQKQSCRQDNHSGRSAPRSTRHRRHFHINDFRQPLHTLLLIYNLQIPPPDNLQSIKTSPNQTH